MLYSSYFIIKVKKTIKHTSKSFYYSPLCIIQKKSRTYQGIEHSCTRFKRSIFSYKIFPEIQYSMQSMFLETVLVLLEKPRIQCHPVLHDNCHRPYIRLSVLAKGWKDVSFLIFSNFFLHFPCRSV